MMDSREAFEKYRDECGKNGYQIPHWDEYQTFKDARSSTQAELEAVKRRELDLAAYVERLRDHVKLCMESHGNLLIVPPAWSADILNETPSQSLEAHDREVRNQQRRDDAELCDSVSGKVCRDNPYDSAYSDGCDDCQEAIEATIEKE